MPSSYDTFGLTCEICGHCQTGYDTIEGALEEGWKDTEDGWLCNDCYQAQLEAHEEEDGD